MGNGNWKKIAQDLVASSKRTATAWELFAKDNSDLMKADPTLKAKIDAFTAAGNEVAAYLRDRLEIR